MQGPVREEVRAPAPRARTGAAAVAVRGRGLAERAVTAALLAILLLAVADSIVDAGWVEEMPELRLLVVLALGCALLLAPLRAHWLPLLGAGLLAGAIVVLWQVLSLGSIDQQPLFWDRFQDLGARLDDWFRQAFSSGIATGNLPFVLFVAAALWGAAFLGSFLMLRRRNAWPVILAGAALIAVNLAYAGGDQWDAHFGVFLGAAVVLALRAHLWRRFARLRDQGSEVPVQMSWHALVVGVLLAALLVGGSRAAPRPDESGALVSIWDRATDPFAGLTDEVDRLFTALGSGRTPPLHSFGEGFALQAEIDPGGSVVVQVETSETGLLRGSSYDRYTGQGWTQSQARPASVPAGEPLPVDPPAGAFGYAARREVTSLISVARSPRVYFSVGQPLVLDDEAEAVQIGETVVRVEVGNPRVPSVAPDLARALREISILQERSELSDLAALSLLPPGYEVLEIERGFGGIAAFVLRSAPVAPDVLALRSLGRIHAGSEYAVRGSVSDATEDELRTAGRAYPQWVLSRNLQLPAELTDEAFARLQALALALTSTARTPYDAAVALESYLCCQPRVGPSGRPIRDASGRPVPLYPFNPLIPPSPAETDAVSWFLFEFRDERGFPLGGYYDYHASAMAVLLRSLGIPARISTGFVLNEGNFDAGSRSFVVRARHAYTWVEVFFPGYGWVDFDPTPSGTGEAFTEIQGRRLGAQRLPPLDPAADASSANPDPRLGGFSAILDDLEGPPGATDPEAVEEEAPEGGSSLVWIALAAVLGTLAAGGLGGRLAWEWSLRGLGPAERSWASLHRLARWAGLAGAPSATPSEFAGRLDARLRAPGDAGRLARHYVRVRYGRGVLDAGERDQVRRSYLRLRGLLLRRILRGAARPRRPSLRRFF